MEHYLCLSLISGLPPPLFFFSWGSTTITGSKCVTFCHGKAQNGYIPWELPGSEGNNLCPIFQNSRASNQLFQTSQGGETLLFWKCVLCFVIKNNKYLLFPKLLNPVNVVCLWVCVRAYMCAHTCFIFFKRFSPACIITWIKNIAVWARESNFPTPI